MTIEPSTGAAPPESLEPPVDVVAPPASLEPPVEVVTPPTPALAPAFELESPVPITPPVELAPPPAANVPPLDVECPPPASAPPVPALLVEPPAVAPSASGVLASPELRRPLVAAPLPLHATTNQAAIARRSIASKDRSERARSCKVYQPPSSLGSPRRAAPRLRSSAPRDCVYTVDARGRDLAGCRALPSRGRIPAPIRRLNDHGPPGADGRNVASSPTLLRMTCLRGALAALAVASACGGNAQIETCESGAQCGGDCVPGSSRCVGDRKAQLCTSSRTWGTTSTCPFACIDGACGGKCVPGTTQCTNGSQETCGNDGTWGSPTPCQYLCDGDVCGGECTPGSVQCASSTEYETCSATGTWSSPVVCANQACVDGACVGSCSPGSSECDATTKNPKTCGSDGTWTTLAKCTVPDQTCAAGSPPKCVANDPYYIGNSSVDSSWSAFEPSTDTSYLTSITVNLTDGAKSAYVLALDYNARVAGGWCDLYLYSDDNGAPGKRLTFVLQARVTAGIGGSVPTADTTVTTGTQYWIGGVCDNSPNTVELEQKSVASETVYISPQTFGTALPTPFPVSNSSPTSGVALPFFMQVQNVP